MSQGTPPEEPAMTNNTASAIAHDRIRADRLIGERVEVDERGNRWDCLHATVIRSVGMQDGRWSVLVELRSGGQFTVAVAALTLA